MPSSLPSRPSLEQLRKQAKDLQKSFIAKDPSAMERVHAILPRLKRPDPAEGGIKLTEAQLVVAREYGFDSWTKLKEHVDSVALEHMGPIEAFHKALEDDDAALFSKLVARYPEMKARINDPIAAFNAPIITMARSRRMLDAMIAAGADLNAKSRWWAGGFGFLHTAPPELARYAIHQGAEVDAHAAARLGMIEKLRELVEKDPTVVNAPGGDGQTPLHFAATVEIAAFLLDHGADIDARDVDHESTPAQYMVRDRQEVLSYLVQRGCKTDLLMAAALGDLALARRHLDADPECIRLRVSDEYFPMIGGKAGGTIYQWTLGWYVSAHQVAKAFRHGELFDFLMARSPDDLKLLTACWLHDTATVHRLNATRPDLAGDLPANDRRSAAHAARNNDLDAVRLMVVSGLPVNGEARSQHGATALHWAAWHGNAAMVELFLQKDPPLEDSRNDFHKTPLGWALHGSENGWHRESGDYPRTVERLLEAGAIPPKELSGTEEVQEVLRRFLGR